MRILVTGATGFVGAATVARLGGHEVSALVRGDDAPARLARALSAAGADPAGATAVPGDLCSPDVALPDADVIVHCAASVSFTLPLEEARAINVEGTRRVLEHAERTGTRLVHVSTAYVAGHHRGPFREDDLEVGQTFRNTYEQTKLEAERMIRDSSADVVVLRPSIVVGDSKTGWTSAFNVVYWPMRAFTRGLMHEVPARPEARIDIIPVDLIADAIAHVATQRPDVGGTLNVVAGQDAVRMDEFVELACATLGRERPPIVPPTAEAADALAEYLDYFDMDVVFDDAHAREILHPVGIKAPLLSSYFARLIEYAESVRWGKGPRRTALASA